MTRTVESTITFPYRRSLGPVIGGFLTALRDRRLVGIRCGDGVLCPPLEWDPRTGARLATELVDVGPAGTVDTWTWVARPTAAHPLDRPFAFAAIRLDGAATSLVHVVDAPSPAAMHVGMRVAPRWRDERRGHITDIEAFVPGEEPTGGDGGGTPVDADPDGGPVEMMDYRASITYATPVTENVVRSEAAARQGRFLGLRCPACARTYTGGKGYCPVDSIALTAEHEVDLPQTGVLTNYTVITPVQYPGQTETEPFARVHVLLDGTDVVLGYQTLLEVPADRVRIGMRLAAVWPGGADGGPDGDARVADGLVGWRPTGEADVDDPDLVNRIC